MNRNVLYVLIAVLLIVLGVVIYSQMRPAQAPSTNNTNLNNGANLNSNLPANNANPSNSNSSSNSQSNAPANSRFSNEGDVNGPDVMVHEIRYNGTAFTPASITIKLGDVVVFRNNSSRAFEPASAPHPTHTDYPEFDAKGAVAAGQTYQFKFTKVGSWGYHDHLNPSAFGNIKVTE